MDRKLTVLMASDDNYCFLLGNALYSLLSANREFDSIAVYVIDDNIGRANREKLLRLADRYHREIYFLPVPQMPSGMVVKGALHISTYYRLALCSLLPARIDKILYLDCDILVRGSLMELWNVDMGGYYLAGVQDVTGANARLSIELEKESDYVNAGVLLVNVALWREKNMEKMFFKYLEEKNYRVEFNDQGVINHCCNGAIKLVHPKYDYMIPYDRYDRPRLLRIVRKERFYSEEEIKEAKSNPLIVHFAGYAFSRPWFQGAGGRFVDEFLELREKSGFPFVLRPQPVGIRYKIRRFAFSLPDNMAICLNQLIDCVYRVYSMVKGG